MKGIIFQKLEMFVEQTWSEELWDELLLECNPKSGGAYTANALYDDNEFFQLVTSLCEKQGLEMVAAQRAFGQWLFAELLKMTPHDISGYTTTFSFLEAVENIVHVEVLKIHQDAVLPSFEFLEHSETHMKMVYRSPRQLCYFCEGLIEALAKHLNENISVRQIECEHEGHERCVLQLDRL
ncbi:heme NO-binding domain-containing protein [Aestuariibacter salexigens]|uniref:heme NO-binding domain-containing protein n=1 Tax=Aestuariibacter salexigens TaxID=226010 RepID=UPI00041B48D7|nr:heme NO-binding domain-containing protein [Aestuariibacter salexigens]